MKPKPNDTAHLATPISTTASPELTPKESLPDGFVKVVSLSGKIMHDKSPEARRAEKRERKNRQQYARMMRDREMAALCKRNCQLEIIIKKFILQMPLTAEEKSVVDTIDKA